MHTAVIQVSVELEEPQKTIEAWIKCNYKHAIMSEATKWPINVIVHIKADNAVRLAEPETTVHDLIMFMSRYCFMNKWIALQR